MRLQFFIHGLNGGGAERVMAILMNAFVKEGHQVEVVCTSSNKDPIYKLDDKIRQVYFNGKESYNGLLSRFTRKVVKYWKIRKTAKQYRPDVVVSFIRFNNIEVLISLMGTGIPVVVGDHTNIERSYPKMTALFTKLLYPHAAAITMLTMRDYNIWKNKYPNVWYVPNPCDTPCLEGGKRENTILAVGRVNQWDIKGFDNLMRAWNMIKTKYPEWKCQIAGDYSDEALKELQAVVTEDEFKSVEFLGFRSDVYNLMATSEVFCLPSRTEGLPMALLEALSLGCACVAFDCVTGPKEMIEDGATGLLVNNQDCDDLSRKLSLIIENTELRERFHKVSPTSVKQFSLESVIKIWTDMFTRLRYSFK